MGSNSISKFISYLESKCILSMNAFYLDESCSEVNLSEQIKPFDINIVVSYVDRTREEFVFSQFDNIFNEVDLFDIDEEGPSLRSIYQSINDEVLQKEHAHFFIRKGHVFATLPLLQMSINPMVWRKILNGRLVSLINPYPSNPIIAISEKLYSDTIKVFYSFLSKRDFSWE